MSEHFAGLPQVNRLPARRLENAYASEPQFGQKAENQFDFQRGWIPSYGDLDTIAHLSVRGLSSTIHPIQGISTAKNQENQISDYPEQQ